MKIFTKSMLHKKKWNIEICEGLLQLILCANQTRNCKYYEQFGLKLCKIKSFLKLDKQATECSICMCVGEYIKGMITYCSVMWSLSFSRCMWDVKCINHKTQSLFCHYLAHRMRMCVKGGLRRTWSRVVFLEVWSVTWNISVCPVLPH